ncbi:hypothetical protein L211DRAFT_846119 [Terfezia boudieri ATCC MYA-4762]|uniref:Uncharacterized protein n=1 Tax=Terfezia boudieri ATCC MYA-4762 TaxID=1051890 RepID=A0A3N4LWQ1_9PEZI|nr:hypothetical protein L211DRAFT_846119 [Terfezia boudieri ATCC MYA-4762]
MVGPTSGISENPDRDSYVEGNSPICNLGASGAPLEALEENPSYETGGEVKTEAIGSGTSPPAPTQKEEAEIQYYEAETEAMIQKVDTNSLLKTKTEVAKLSVIARLIGAGKDKPSTSRWSRKIQWNIQRTPALIGGFNGKFQESSRYKTLEEDTCINTFLEQDVIEAEVTTTMEKKKKEEQMSTQKGKGRQVEKVISPPLDRPTLANKMTLDRQQSETPGTGDNTIPIGGVHRECTEGKSGTR